MESFEKSPLTSAALGLDVAIPGNLQAVRARALGHSQPGVFALTPICFPQLLEQCLSIYYGSAVDPMERESLCVGGVSDVLSGLSLLTI